MGFSKYWRVLAAAVALLGPARTEALPMLRLFLDGEVEQLGSGGAGVFRDLQAEAHRLERPTLLATQERPQLRMRLENESILRLDAGKWAGTEIWDRKLQLTAVVPLGGFLLDLPTTAFVGVSRETGRTHIASRRDGPLIDARESRDTVQVGLAAALPWGLSLAGSVGTNGTGHPGWLLEARYQPDPLATVWVRRKESGWDYELHVPEGVARRMRSPPVRYRIDELERHTELGGELGRRDLAWATGALGVDQVSDYWFELGGRPVPWIAVRLGGDREIFRFDDQMEAGGTGTIADVDVGLRRDRWFGGVDAQVGPGQIEARYVHSALRGSSEGEEVGTAAARAFLQIDYDLGLFLQGGYRIDGRQMALGWRHAPETGIGYAVGAQLFRLEVLPSEFAIHSDRLQRSLASEQVRPGTADLLGVTGSLHVPVGRFRFGAALGQFVPIASEQQRPPGPRPAPGPRPPPQPAPDRGPYEWLTGSVGKALDKLGKYGGGNRLLFELTTDL